MRVLKHKLLALLFINIGLLMLTLALPSGLLFIVMLILTIFNLYQLLKNK